MGVCHRDLKPENFIFETKDSMSDLKVIDFGLSKIFDSPISKFESLKIWCSEGLPSENEDKSWDSKNCRLCKIINLFYSRITYLRRF